jgi:hypothetical protein
MQDCKEKICVECGKTYKPTSNVQKRCEECKKTTPKKSSRAPIFKERFCVDCKGPFIPTGPAQLRCTVCAGLSPDERTRRYHAPTVGLCDTSEDEYEAFTKDHVQYNDTLILTQDLLSGLNAQKIILTFASTQVVFVAISPVLPVLPAAWGERLESARNIALSAGVRSVKIEFPRFNIVFTNTAE